MLSLYFLVILSICKPDYSKEEQIDENIGETRRILRGTEVFDTRPYMVFLRPILGPENGYVPPNWLCGGVIIHERYVLTSAACIQEITYFYVVSGTHRWVPPSETNECIENGAMRAIWKCVPRTYRYDGRHFNNIRWMVDDIAVVMTEAKFSFTKRVKGCEFIPKKVFYNNESKSLENSGTKGYIAGWGSNSEYTDAADMVSRTSVNSPVLQEAISIVIQKPNCKLHWLKRYHSIIDNYMICGKIVPTVEMSGDCNDHHVACRQLFFSEEEGPRSRRFETDPDRLLLESAAHVKNRQQYRKKGTRRQIDSFTNGGFCENDHGGPLIIGEGNAAMVIGIISAYMTKNNTKRCYGPYLYTSVFNNRKLIQCALYKESGGKCDTLLRDSSTVLEEENVNWGEYPTRVWKFDDSPLGYPLLRSGNVTAFEGSSNDTAFEGSGNDTAFEGSGNDTAFEGSGNDTAFDGSGNDIASDPAYEENNSKTTEIGSSTSKS